MSKDINVTETILNYKKFATRAFIPITPEQIDARLMGNTFFVSRKYDGMTAIILWDGNTLSAYTSSGASAGVAPCFDEAAAVMKSAKLSEAVFAAELYAEESGGRSRVFDALKAVASAKERLALAFFDIISLNGEPFKVSSWKETLEKLVEIFGKGERVKPVLTEKASDKNGVKKLFEEWVEKAGAEGLVVRSELPLVFKIKPKYSIDAAVIGFSVGVPSSGAGATPYEVRTLLLALADENGYQIIGRTGNIPSEIRKDLYEKLMQKRVPSAYIETDSNHTAFYMVKPETVIEISVLDVIFEDGTGPIYNQRLNINEEGWRRTGAVQGFSFISPIFERFREDKKADNALDVRLTQIAERFYNPGTPERAESTELPKSELLKREVYKKESGGKLMVLKFLMWKTNKEGSGWPAYAAACVNYSSDRAESLKQDMRISGDLGQTEELYNAFIAANVKKGWEKIR